MLRYMVIATIVLMCAYVGYQLQAEVEPVVVEPESSVSEVVETPPTVVYIQYTTEEDEAQYANEQAEYEAAPTPMASPSMPELPGGPVSCQTFGSPWTAQQYMDAYPASAPILDPEGDGHACGSPAPKTVTAPIAERKGTPENPCYPSCQYEALQKLTPDEREAIGAVRHMPPYQKAK